MGCQLERFPAEVAHLWTRTAFEWKKDGVRAGMKEIRYTIHIRTDADEEKTRDVVDCVKKPLARKRLVARLRCDHRKRSS